MDLPPDPYVALGVTKDADATAIKKAYRALALKLHPDKCTDESQKAARTDEFTKIQQAWDILQDDDKRSHYDASVRLAELKRQNFEMRGGPRGDYNIRTAAPKGFAKEDPYMSSSSRAPPPRPYEYEPRPRSYEYEYDDYEPMRGSTRKTSGADDYAYVRKSGPKEEKREKPRTTAPREEERKRDAKRREAEVKASRSSKYEEYEDRDRERRRRDREYESARRNESDSYGSSTEKVYEEKFRQAQEHINKSGSSTRPHMPRRESSRQVPGIYREHSDVRRSAAPPKDKERRRASPEKEYRRSENLDPYADRRVPNLSSHASAPPVVETTPQPHRSHTTPAEDLKKKKSRDQSPPPFPRSTTTPADAMPNASSSKRRETRGRMMPEDSGYSSPNVTPGYSGAYTHVDERAAPPVSYSNGHRTVLREPSSSARRTEPSPARPSKGAVKMKGLDPTAGNPKIKRTTQYSYAPGPGAPTPIIVEPKSSSRRERVSERDREYFERERSRQQYFGENGNGTVDPRYQSSAPYEHVTYAPHPTQTDVRYSSGRGRDSYSERPSVLRSTTFAY